MFKPASPQQLKNNDVYICNKHNLHTKDRVVVHVRFFFILKLNI